jgi:hypothetical protein
MLSESPERAAVDPRARVLATALDGSVVFADDEGAASREILPAKSGLS